MATPIFEFAEVFSRPLGDSSDVVTKETYNFTDRGGETLTLRPENTAGVVRAMISNGLTQSLPLKFFYAGPMFRYERPQKGRMRQFPSDWDRISRAARRAGGCRNHRLRRACSRLVSVFWTAVGCT